MIALLSLDTGFFLVSDSFEFVRCTRQHNLRENTVNYDRAC